MRLKYSKENSFNINTITWLHFYSVREYYHYRLPKLNINLFIYFFDLFNIHSPLCKSTSLVHWGFLYLLSYPTPLGRLSPPSGSMLDRSALFMSINTGIGPGMGMWPKQSQWHAMISHWTFWSYWQDLTLEALETSFATTRGQPAWKWRQHYANPKQRSRE